MNKIYEELKAAGRYDQIQEIIAHITEKLDDRTTYPLPLHGRNDDRVLGAAVKHGLWFVKGVIHSSINPVDYIEQEKLSGSSVTGIGCLDDTHEYVESITNMYLHNYTITISHRKLDPDPDIEVIRGWLILEGICLNILLLAEDNFGDEDIRKNIDEYYIPDGWRRISKDGVDLNKEGKIIYECR